jgi:hypothetical protein
MGFVSGGGFLKLDFIDSMENWADKEDGVMASAVAARRSASGNFEEKGGMVEDYSCFAATLVSMTGPSRIGVARPETVGKPVEGARSKTTISLAPSRSQGPGTKRVC